MYSGSPAICKSVTGNEPQLISIGYCAFGNKIQPNFIQKSFQIHE